MKYLVKKVLISIIFVAVLSFSISPLTSFTTATTLNSTTDVDTAIQQAVAYLKTQQNDDGGIRWIDESSSMAVSIRVVLALAAAGLPQDILISQQGNNPVDFLAEQGYRWIFQSDADEPALNIARAGQLLTAVAAADQDPHTFGAETVNLVHLIRINFDPNTGVFGNATPENVTDQVWAILGLAAAYAAVPAEAVEWLANTQLDDGSWDDGFGSYLDTTPLAIMALISSGLITENDPEIMLALDFIRENQNPNGGWQTEWDANTNANTTGMLLQSLYAAGNNPAEPPWVREEGSPLTALLQIQQENGAIGGDFINAYGTADAILGLSGQPLYDLSTLRRVGRAFEYIFASQDEDGGWGNVGQTLDVIIATSAAGWDPATIAQGGQTPFDYLAQNLNAYLENGPDAIGKTMLAFAASGHILENFNGINLEQILLDTYNPELNAFGSPENTWHQSLSILGLKASNAALPDGVIQTLLNLQREDGGWEYSTGFGTWPDNTALALQALLASGLSANEDAIQNGLSYLRSQQLEGGGWGDSSTTAFVIMALNALGISADEWQTESNKTPIQDLLSYQNPSGALKFSDDFPDDNLMATTTAVLAVIKGNYHIQPTEQEPGPAAGLVVQTDQGEITTACVRFDGESTSGLALLNASGIPYQAQDGFMNSIMDVSNPQGGTLYWSYWHWDGREWVFNNTGAGDSVVLPGSIEAWYFTSWELFPSLPPDFVPLLKVICGENNAKSFAVQPHLQYYDLYQPSATASQTTSFAPEEMEQVTGITSIKPQTQVEPLPITPIIIIGVLGVIVFALIIWLLIRKK
jgi:hypothetical protein